MEVPSTNDLRVRFSKGVRQYARRLVADGVTINQVIFTSFGLSLFYAALLYADPAARWQYALFPLLLFARTALTNVQEIMANELGQTKKLGSHLVEITSVASDAVLCLPFAALAPNVAPAVVVFAILTVLVEFAGILALTIGKARSYAGPLKSSARGVFLCALAILTALGCGTPFLIGGAMTFGCVLLCCSIVNRIRAGL